MNRVTSRTLLVLTTALLSAPPAASLHAADAAIHGRFVRVEAPASSRMGLYEIEVWSGDANVALKNKELKFTGVSYRGRDINERNEGRLVVDGVADFNKRSFELSTAGGGVNPWMEIDFGAERRRDGDASRPWLGTTWASSGFPGRAAREARSGNRSLRLQQHQHRYQG